MVDHKAGGIMLSYPVEIRRCQHIKTNGTQCGSPALRPSGANAGPLGTPALHPSGPNAGPLGIPALHPSGPLGTPALREGRFCYHHQECRAERVTVQGGEGKGSEILVPVFEDAHSIQMMVRQVVMLLLEDKIDGQKAGRVLYGLQIAAANLKRMEGEKPRPVQVVVDVAKVAETPLGMTPWSGSERGHELEDEAVGFQGEMAAQLKREASAVRERYGMQQREARRLAREMKEYLAGGPGANYEELRRNMAIMADKIEEYLAG